MDKLRIVDVFELDGYYYKNKLVNILNLVFDNSYPTFTQNSNPKTFKVKMYEKHFKIVKIDKLADSSDPMYMALTQIRVVLGKSDDACKLTLYSEIHVVWYILMIIGLLVGLICGVFVSVELISIIPLMILQYLIMRHLAKEDLAKFGPYFEGLIRKAKVY